MTSVSGINPLNGDNKTFKNQAKLKETVEQTAIFGNPAANAAQDCDDFSVKGLSVETSNVDVHKLYEDKFRELQKMINEKEAKGIKPSKEEYEMMERYDILASDFFNQSEKLLTKEEEDAVAAAGRNKIETENPYWNEYKKLQAELDNYIKTSPDRTSAKYRELLNKFNRYDALVSTYNYKNGGTNEEYEKTHPVSGSISSDTKSVNIKKEVSANSGGFSLRGSVDTNLSMQDIEFGGERSLSSTVSGGAGYSKNNLSINTGAEIGMSNLAERSITPDYNLSANASYNIKGFNLTGGLRKNFGAGSDMTTREFTLSKNISNFNLTASHSVQEMSGESTSTTRTG